MEYFIQYSQNYRTLIWAIDSASSRWSHLLALILLNFSFVFHYSPVHWIAREWDKPSFFFFSLKFCDLNIGLLLIYWHIFSFLSHFMHNASRCIRLRGEEKNRSVEQTLFTITVLYLNFTCSLFHSLRQYGLGHCVLALLPLIFIHTLTAFTSVHWDTLYLYYSFSFRLDIGS